MKMIDLRSDTVTQPTAEMRAAMLSAPLGDDVFGEDPTVNLLQETVAGMFGMEAALFCPSGTMTNQIAIQLHSKPLSEVICDESAHVYLYEVGGIAHHSRASVRLLAGDRGRISAGQIEKAINADNIHYPVSRLVCLENTSNRGGGSCYDWNEILLIRRVCDSHNLSLHLDGARLFHALLATKQSAPEYGKTFDSISICLSKGLGAPVGSLLLGKKDFIKEALRVRKVMGGGMRQAGILAAAGLHALNHQVSRLVQDHYRARLLGQAVAALSWVETLLPVETNIVLFKLKPGIKRGALATYMESCGIRIGGFDPDWVRLVPHLDIDDSGVEATMKALETFSPR